MLEDYGQDMPTAELRRLGTAVRRFDFAAPGAVRGALPINVWPIRADTPPLAF